MILVLTRTGQSTEAISHSSTLRAGIESAIRFTKTEMIKLETQKVALDNDMEDSRNKLRDSARASHNLHINMALMERNVSDHDRMLLPPMLTQ